MMTEGTNLLVLKCLSSGAHLGGPRPPRWAPEGREVSHKVVVIHRFHWCILEKEAPDEKVDVVYGGRALTVDVFVETFLFIATLSTRLT